MQYLLDYLFLSLAIGFLSTLYDFWMCGRNISGWIESKQAESSRALEKYVQSGDIQKEVYGERTVVYPKTSLGEAAIRSVDRTRAKKNKLFMKLLVSFVSFFSMSISRAIFWPRNLYRKLK